MIDDDAGFAAGERVAEEAAKEIILFEKAWRELPACIDTDPLAMRTLEVLRFACRIQLDLIEEGQDGTEDDDPKAIRRWLKNWTDSIDAYEE